MTSPDVDKWFTRRGSPLRPDAKAPPTGYTSREKRNALEIRDRFTWELGRSVAPWGAPGRLAKGIV